MASGAEISKILLNYFPLNHSGVLLEVGAGHPVNISISHHFRNLNWNIISVEPIPEHCEEFRRMNLPILQYAACSQDIGDTTFQVSPNLVSCSALKVRYEGMYDKFNTITVHALTLNTILKKHHPEITGIDILIIDVEGWELDVLRGFDLVQYNPKVLCLEFMGDGVNATHTYICEQGYRLDKQEAQDRFYVKQ